MKRSNAIVKVDLADNWKKAVNYIPDSFTIIVYEYEEDSPKIKIGDGVHTVEELPFLNQKEVKDNNLIL